MGLSSRINKEIPVHIQQRLQYQWKGMNQMASSSSSIQLAHNLAMHFSNVAFEYSVDLPEFVSDKICRFCSSFLVPSLTSTIRLVKRKNGKDEILSTCLACNRVTKRVQKPHMKKKCRKRKADIVNNGKDDVNNVKKNKSFSFLDKSSGVQVIMWVPF